MINNYHKIENHNMYLVISFYYIEDMSDKIYHTSETSIMTLIPHNIS